VELKGQKTKEAERDVFLQTWQWSALVGPLLLVISAWGIIFVASALLETQSTALPCIMRQKR
jgi:hypothetical protein